MSFFYKENPDLEEKLCRYFEGLSSFNDEHFGGTLSVVLLGSLSRGEGSWINKDGGDILLSDIEFFTVYTDQNSDFEIFDRFVQSYAQEILGDNISELFHVDNTYVSKTKIKTLEKKLLTFDAAFFGKCVVGEDVMPLFPKIDINNINLFDIRDILTHRAFYVLYYGSSLRNDVSKEEYRYLLAKNSLDLMTVLLVENGILESGFINRFEKIKTLNLPENIKKYFWYCLSVKLGRECEYEFTVEEMRKIFLDILKQARKDFKLRMPNIAVNFKSIARRQLGIIKRAVKYRHLVYSSHLSRLISSIEKNEKITQREIADNLVLNGYPVKWSLSL